MPTNEDKVAAAKEYLLSLGGSDKDAEKVKWAIGAIEDGITDKFRTIPDVVELGAKGNIFWYNWRGDDN